MSSIRRCRGLIMSIGFQTKDDFIAGLVCRGSFYMAQRGLFRVIKGSLRNNNLEPVLLSEFNSESFSFTRIPITPPRSISLLS